MSPYFLLACLLVCTATSTAQEVLHVSSSGDDTAGEGDLASPFRTISRAIEASLSGDTIILGPGIYRGKLNCNLSFRQRSSGTAKKLSVEGSSGSAETIVDCSTFGRVMKLAQGEDISFRGLTLTGGFATFGGAAWIRDCTPSFTDVVFRSSTGQLGGAVLCDVGCNAIISQVTFQDNEGSKGGALYVGRGANLTMADVLFLNNTAVEGGGVYQAGGVTDCTFCRFNGSSAARGAGLGHAAGSVLLSNSVFLWNEAVSGGAVSVYSLANIFIFNSSIFNNSADTGAALEARDFAAATLMQSTIIFNSARSGGGAFFAAEQAVATAIGCKLNWNRDLLVGQAAPPDLARLLVATATFPTGDGIPTVLPALNSTEKTILESEAAASITSLRSDIINDRRQTVSFSGSNTVCSGGGTWEGESPSLQCSCDSIHVGDECQLQCPGAPTSCSGHGKCVPDSSETFYPCRVVGGKQEVCEKQGFGHCTCDFGYVGRDCSLFCPGTISETLVCSGHGVCEEHLGQAVCSCEFGWSGKDCSRLRLFADALSGMATNSTNTTMRRVVRLGDVVIQNHGNSGLALVVLDRRNFDIIWDSTYDTSLSQTLGGAFFATDGQVQDNDGEINVNASMQQPVHLQQSKGHFDEQNALRMARDLSTFGDNHLIVVTSFGEWEKELNAKLCQELLRHGAPSNISDYINSKEGGSQPFVLIAVGGRGLSNSSFALGSSPSSNSMSYTSVDVDLYFDKNSESWLPVALQRPRLETWEPDIYNQTSHHVPTWDHGKCGKLRTVKSSVSTQFAERVQLKCLESSLEQEWRQRWEGSKIRQGPFVAYHPLDYTPDQLDELEARVIRDSYSSG